MSGQKNVDINLRLSLSLSLVFLFVRPARSQAIHEYMDLQIHPTMHIAHSNFTPGLTYFDEEDPPKLTYKHTFTNVNYANYWENNKGCRIFVVGFMTKERIRNRQKARSVILEQMKYVEDFVQQHPDKFAVAKSPGEVRKLVTQTKKTIIVYSIEGGKSLIGSEEDAKFWADKGVAFVTLIHMLDSELGSSAIRPGILYSIINPKGALRSKKKRGLTDLGRNAIQWLANAGIMTDISHMSDSTRADALDLMEEKGIPPVSTHDMFKPIQNMQRSISEVDVIRIYQAHGFMSLPLSGISLKPHRPDPKYKKLLESQSDYCNGSVDTYRFTYEALQSFLEENVSRIFKDNSKTMGNLTEDEKIDLAIGFQSDFNGWLNHSRPRYGKKGCKEVAPGTVYEPIELKGLAHPGLMESQWKWMAKEHVDLEPILRASEKFLRVWESVIKEKAK
ncbi:MAG: membrane dipeptidase [Saprospiraceae bacterium]|uniref:Membrane dipeptidase n=1 Tax=Candidatus Opimibacter skivensis TaxID=2982028 RepID=A0A9D7XSR3_9BACT|nr:membrane dipeptidase [Candidatus Opimibacter skivensis]